MTSIPVTLGTAGIMGLILLALSFNVTRVRIRTRVISGDGGGAPGTESLAVAMRIQANFVEYVPMILVLMGGIEAAGAPRWLLLALAVALIVARLAHPLGMTMKAPNLPRAGGAMLTWAVLGVAALTAVAIAF
jgi:uncharacterized membrane protein YecN with MAPEG domain